MATFEITSPDGATYHVDVPEGASESDALAHLQGHLSSNEQSEAPTGFLGKLGKVWENPSDALIKLPVIGTPSLVGMAKSGYQAFMAPSQIAASGVTEKPGVMTEEDAFRQNQAQDAMIPSAVNMAGNIALPQSSGPARITTPAFVAARQAAKEIPGANAGAVSRMAKSYGNDELTPEIVAQQQQQLGPEAMMLDMGRQMEGRAGAIADQPGKGQNTVLNAVQERVHGRDQFKRVQQQFGQASADRIKQTLNAQLVPVKDKVKLINDMSDLVDSKAKPLYDSVMNDYPVVNVPSEITSRPAVASAMKNATTLAKQYGETLESPTETRTILKGPSYHIADDITAPAKTGLRYWDYVKKDMDRRINAYMRSGGTSELNSADKADLGGLMDARTALRNHLDTVTNGEYANARSVAAAKPQLTEAYDTGRGAFNNKLLPEEFADQINNMSAPEQVMAKAGYRRELERMVDTSRNDGAKARAMLDNNSNLQKTENLFGPRARQAIEDRIAAETRFQSAANNIAGNSRTAVRTQAAKDTELPSVAMPPIASFTGYLHKGGMGTLNYLRNQGMENTRAAIGRMSTMQGPELQNLAKVLSDYNASRVRSNAPISPAISVPTISGLAHALTAPAPLQITIHPRRSDSTQ